MIRRKTWTRAEVIEQVTGIATSLSHFPSLSELRSLARNDLAVQVTRHGGFIALSKEIGIDRAHSDSDTGWDGEIEVAKLIAGKGYRVEHTAKLRNPFDLLVNGCVRLDVKTAKYAAYGACRGHFYRIGKVPTCDVVVLYQSDTGKCYVLPWSEVPYSNITISQGGGKYARFFENWDLIQKLTEGMKPLSAA